MRTALLAILALSAAGAAQAQNGENTSNKPAPIQQPRPPQITTPGTPPSTVVVGRDGQNSGPGANATIARSGTGAETVTTDSAVGGNTQQPTRAVPQEGGGGGGGGGGS
ncbi:hypothetical protein Q8W71_08245 [Methylobacterium sp. NEAU 140]|uniref:hypothetical protein n=1 Tax=Methylobacterium sp. NEAU 140 TaxID=3064945 RepID=UPI0027372321|nr:hypothetical protein [Methylobacterium sp. NEAU 140]MDP4022608.1 hypothetical protein [Methylobacterium sp. NEAU 140]